MSEFVTTSRGDRVAFDRRGTGPAIVFIAGAGIHRTIDPSTTETAQKAADAGLTTIVHDRLGRGESPADGTLDLDRELEAVAALIQEAGGRAVLCGHSSGGTIALAAAVRGLPVAGLLLWEAPVTGESGEMTTWSAEVLRRIDEGNLEGALEHYMKDMPPEWLEGARQSSDWDAIVSGVLSYVADAQSLAWIESAPLSELLGGLRIPVEFLAGSETFPEMLHAAEVVTAAIPGAVSKRLKGADHSWDPDAMANEVVRFVNAAQ
jgi:pimeloyl-ACP methyl ester carboxylesterase